MKGKIWAIRIGTLSKAAIKTDCHLDGERRTLRTVPHRKGKEPSLALSTTL